MRIVAIASVVMLLMAGGHASEVRPWMLLYIGPDLLLPFTSAIAAALGVVLMFWNRLIGWARNVWRALFRRRV
jgi:hypothetical protein